MANYQPCSSPSRPSSKDSNILTEAKYLLHLAYYRYEINTGQYVMSSGEKITYNLVVLSLLGLIFFAISYFLPQSAIAGMHRMVYYLTGQRQAIFDLVRAMDGVLQQNSGGYVASLKDAGVVVVLNANNTDAFAMR